MRTRTACGRSPARRAHAPGPSRQQPNRGGRSPHRSPRSRGARRESPVPATELRDKGGRRCGTARRAADRGRQGRACTPDSGSGLPDALQLLAGERVVAASELVPRAGIAAVEILPALKLARRLFLPAERHQSFAEHLLGFLHIRSERGRLLEHDLSFCRVAQLEVRPAQHDERGRIRGFELERGFELPRPPRRPGRRGAAPCRDWRASPGRGDEWRPVRCTQRQPRRTCPPASAGCPPAPAPRSYPFELGRPSRRAGAAAWPENERA